MLEWNVYEEDFNAKKIVVRNVFNLSWRFNEYLKENFKENKIKGEFCEQLRRDLQYCYWSKCEHEIIITSWPQREDVEKKVDVYSQVMMNWNQFANYVWNNRHLINNL